MGTIRLFITSEAFHDNRNFAPKLRNLYTKFATAFGIAGLDEIIDFWALSMCDVLIQGASTYSLWASATGEAAQQAEGRYGVPVQLPTHDRNPEGPSTACGSHEASRSLSELVVPARRCSIPPPIMSLSNLLGDPLLGPPSPGCSRLTKAWWHEQRCMWAEHSGVLNRLWSAESNKHAEEVFHQASNAYQVAWGGHLGGACVPETTVYLS